MYTQKSKTRLEKFKRISYWIKRKLILIIAAFMIGISNGMNNEDKMTDKNQYHIEQNDKKD